MNTNNLKATSTLELQKQHTIDNAIICAYNADCCEGNGGYYVSAYCSGEGLHVEISADIKDSSVSLREFEKTHI